MRNFELRTKYETFRFTSGEATLVDVTEKGDVQTERPEALSELEDGYKSSVLECHKVLDYLKIPSAKGQSCTEPACKSQLGHRLRTLRDKYIQDHELVVAVSKIVDEATEDSHLKGSLAYLLDKNREH